MDKQQLLELANDYANEADELEASAINAAEVAIASIKAGELEEALDLLKAAAENVKGASAALCARPSGRQNTSKPCASGATMKKADSPKCAVAS